MAAELIGLSIGVLFAGLVIFIRLKASKKPTNAKKLLLPPVFMLTGFLMFIEPKTWIPFWEAGIAFLVGMAFSFFLIKTSKFERVGNDVYLKRSKAFAFILIGLLLVRTVMKLAMEQAVSLPQTASFFFILALGMLLPWRLSMYLTYRRLLENGPAESER
ncbi:cytochrome c biogenesis protein CcdC [Sporolactobacillus shoreae]|uniref:Cytochrome c biogenesis protein CcdC n=1 Tax=Sporolactobacillus shoreae TaxID=1465501 RepID=A0A4Z0GW15_9BACL|nr:cytochrome c biogenesis protein CcdC [Sporolactobacillus shoreae]TGB00476.1 cytochrome c biogenesis protein CcdC [Sporolactobacillus shoreae]